MCCIVRSIHVNWGLECLMRVHPFLSQPVIHDCDLCVKPEVSEPCSEQTSYPELWHSSAGWLCAFQATESDVSFIILGVHWSEWSAEVTLPVVQNIAAKFRIHTLTSKKNKKHLSLLGSCKPAYRRRTNVWFKIQVYSCSSMIFAIVVLSILAINSLIWRPTFLQQGFSIQHERSGFSCSFCSQWLHAWGFWKMSSALMAAIWKWETLTS